ncbi:hypothetical protein Taro_028302 [Colocasia esculenta]|uniref:Uncharacterized protein n=1 Tax=Colocasia esculenta TaxID=4460 RepID=A0A843VKP6_COLES|nr:hypothetical protein [Colocasia esculenta]
MGRVPFVSCTAAGDVDTELCLGIRPGSTIPRRLSTPPPSSSPRRQPLTIFYSDRICVCSVTAEEAGAVVAAAEVELDVRNLQSGSRCSPCSSSLSSVASVKEGNAPAAAAVEIEERLRAGLHAISLPRAEVSQAQLLLNTRSPMRRSLQRFLQKRKAGTAANTSPYARPFDRLHHPGDGQRCPRMFLL